MNRKRHTCSTSILLLRKPVKKESQQKQGNREKKGALGNIMPYMMMWKGPPRMVRPKYLVTPTLRMSGICGENTYFRIHDMPGTEAHQQVAGDQESR